MQRKSVVVNSYIGALIITIVASGATLIITNVANNIAYADDLVSDMHQAGLYE